MAKQKANVNTIYIGAVGGANPPATPGKILNKGPTTVDVKSIRDDATTDDSAGPEKFPIYPGIITGAKTKQLVDTSDPSYDFLRARTEDGASFLFCWRPDGDGVGKRQGVCAMFVDKPENKDPQKIASVEWTFEATGGTTWSTQ